MQIDWNNVRIFIKPGVTDMRKQINGLAVITEEEMQQNPLSGHLYMFCSRNRSLLKVLYWDKNGFCLWKNGWRSINSHGQIQNRKPGR